MTHRDTRSAFSLLRFAEIRDIFSLGIAFSLATTIVGCGSNATFSPTAPSPTNEVQLEGFVHGGQQPIVGATIQLWAAGTSADQSAATPLISSVLTGSAGQFSITGLYTCPTIQSEVYLTATGGQPWPRARNQQYSQRTCLRARALRQSPQPRTSSSTKPQPSAPSIPSPSSSHTHRRRRHLLSEHRLLHGGLQHHGRRLHADQRIHQHRRRPVSRPHSPRRLHRARRQSLHPRQRHVRLRQLRRRRRRRRLRLLCS